MKNIFRKITEQEYSVCYVIEEVNKCTKVIVEFDGNHKEIVDIKLSNTL